MNNLITLLQIIMKKEFDRVIVTETIKPLN